MNSTENGADVSVGKSDTCERSICGRFGQLATHAIVVNIGAARFSARSVSGWNDDMRRVCEPDRVLGYHVAISYNFASVPLDEAVLFPEKDSPDLIEEFCTFRSLGRQASIQKDLCIRKKVLFSLTLFELLEIRRVILIISDCERSGASMARDIDGQRS